MRADRLPHDILPFSESEKILNVRNQRELWCGQKLKYSAAVLTINISWCCWSKGFEISSTFATLGSKQIFSKIENTLFWNSPINVGNQNGLCLHLYLSARYWGGQGIELFTYIGQCGKHCLVSSYNEWSISELNWGEKGMS